MSGTFYRGTTNEQDGRFSNKEKKLLKGLGWPEEYRERIDIKKIKMDVIKRWVEEKVKDYGIDDELVTPFIIGELEGAGEKGMDGKSLVMNLQGNRTLMKRLYEGKVIRVRVGVMEDLERGREK